MVVERDALLEELQKLSEMAGSWIAWVEEPARGEQPRTDDRLREVFVRPCASAREGYG